MTKMTFLNIGMTSSKDTKCHEMSSKVIRALERGAKTMQLAQRAQPPPASSFTEKLGLWSGRNWGCGHGATPRITNLQNH
jgi:hypothetical protein